MMKWELQKSEMREKFRNNFLSAVSVLLERGTHRIAGAQQRKFVLYHLGRIVLYCSLRKIVTVFK